MGKRLLGFTVLLLLVSIPLFSQDTIPQTALDPIVGASTLNDVAPKDQIVPNQGFSFSSLWRGMLGMLVLIAISYLFSSNRRAINWRTVGLGLSAQFLLAIGVLKIPFIRTFFTIMGKAFNKVLTFTEAGTKFLFSSFTTNEIEEPLVTFAIQVCLHTQFGCGGGVR